MALSPAPPVKTPMNLSDLSNRFKILRRRLSPELGLVYQDGGTPVHGLARRLDPERWDRLARECFLTERPQWGRTGISPRTLEGGRHGTAD